MSRSAYWRAECHSLVVLGPDSQVLQCFECDAEIPADAAACPKCREREALLQARLRCGGSSASTRRWTRIGRTSDSRSSPRH